MVKLYFNLKLRICCRILKELGIVYSLIVLALFAVLLFYTSNAPANYILIVYTILIMLIRQSRKDIALLQNLFGMRYQLLLISENFILGLPFYLILGIQESYLHILLILIVAIAFPFIPLGYTEFKLPTHALIQKGSIEYKRSMRLYGIFYAISIVISIIGIYYHNIRITEVTMIINTSVIGSMLMLPISPTYLYHYASAKHIIENQIILNFYNNLVLIAPFLVILICYQPSWLHLGNCLVVYFSTSLFLLQTNLLRLIFSTNNIIMEFIFLGLIGVCLITIAIPILFVLSLIITLYMIYKSYTNIKLIL